MSDRKEWAKAKAGPNGAYATVTALEENLSASSTVKGSRLKIADALKQARRALLDEIIDVWTSS